MKHFFVILVFAVFICLGHWILTEKLSERRIEPPVRDLLWVQGNSLKASVVPSFPLPFQILGMLLDEIDKRESKGNPTACNTCKGTKWEGLYNPDNCPCGAGLYGLIPSTVRYCEEKLNKPINPFDPESSKECATWLLENEGIRHWEGDGTWGTGPYDVGEDFK